MIGQALTPLAGDLDPSLSWDKQIDDAMHELHQTLQRHPGVLDLIIAESNTLRLDDFRQSLITTPQKAGLSRARSADVLRSLTSYILGYTLLGRLRPTRSGGARPADSFDFGLEIMMRSLRGEVDGVARNRKR
jgi:hypothetical protein